MADYFSLCLSSNANFNKKISHGPIVSEKKFQFSFAIVTWFKLHANNE